MMADFTVPTTVQTIYDSLPAKQKAFVREYVKVRNGTQAATAAGYSAKSAAVQASKLLKKGKVAEVIQAFESTALQAAADDLGVTTQWIAQQLKIVADRAMVEYDDYNAAGEPTGRKKFEGQVACRALELLGKWQKMFTDKQEVSTPPGERVRVQHDGAVDIKAIESLSADELEAKLAAIGDE